MRQVEEIIEDVRRIYQEVMGRPAPEARDVGMLAPFPLGVDPVAFLQQEYLQLKNILGMRSLAQQQFVRPVWHPPAEVYETPTHLHVAIEVPGVNREDINCSVQQNALVVRGERKFNGRFEKPPVFRTLERNYGAFEKVVLLPAYVRTENIEARLENGMLYIKLEKSTGQAPGEVRIPVQ